jgi:hypothetical protein
MGCGASETSGDGGSTPPDTSCGRPGVSPITGGILLDDLRLE